MLLMMPKRIPFRGNRLKVRRRKRAIRYRHTRRWFPEFYENDLGYRHKKRVLEEQALGRGLR